MDSKDPSSSKKPSPREESLSPHEDELKTLSAQSSQTEKFDGGVEFVVSPSRHGFRTPLETSKSSPRRCSLCFVPSSTGNHLQYLTSSEVTNLRDLEIENDKFNCKPFMELSIEAHDSNMGTKKPNTSICKQCMEGIKVIQSLEKLRSFGPQNLLEESQETAARFRETFFVRRNRYVRDIEASVQTADISKKCECHGKGKTPCSIPATPLYHPSRLSRSANQHLRNQWIKVFSSKTEVSRAHAARIWNCALEVFLCPAHTSKMKNALEDARTNMRACSICMGGVSSRKKKRVVKFDWVKLSKNECVRCVVEDAVAVFTENSIRPSDIRQLCDGCRRVILRQVDMEGIVVRSGYKRASRLPHDVYTSDSGFCHGPTPKAVKATISRIRSLLWKKGSEINHVVFISDAQKFYALKCQEYGEHLQTIGDIRTLKKYLCPSLAATDILPRVGSRKIGSFFYCVESFDSLAQEAKSGKGDDENVTMEEYNVMLDEVSSLFQKTQNMIREFSWSLSFIIRQLPRKLWLFEMVSNQPKWLTKRAKSHARVLRESYTQQWPFDPRQVPDNVECLPQNELTITVRTLMRIETVVLARTNGRARGPLITATSVTAFGHSKKGFIDVLSRLGVTASYQTLFGWRENEIAQREVRGPYSTLDKNCLMVVGIDNINMRSRNQLAVCGSTYDGFDGLAVQAINPSLTFDFKKYCFSRPLSDRIPIAIDLSQLRENRERYISENFPRQDDPDISAFRSLVCGLAIAHRDILTSEDSVTQRSFRSVILSALQGHSNGKARVEYVEIAQCNANSIVEIIDRLRAIEDALNPRDERASGEDYVMVVVHGDQPIFKMLFKLWFDSYKHWLQAGAPSTVDPGADNLCRWMVPVPGGFHIDKQGLIPLIKDFLAGSGIEELLKFSGFSPNMQKLFQSLGQYRANRRYLSQITAAMILRIDEAMRSKSTDYSKLRDKCLEDISADKARFEPNYFKSEDEIKERRDAQMEHMQGSGIELDLKVCPSTIQLGQYFVGLIYRESKEQPNLDFYGRLHLMEMLLPWMGYNALARTGQTGLVDKFYFVFVSLMHRTNKIRYMENMLYYSFIKKTMPRVVYHALYEQRHFVVNINVDPNAVDCNFHLDECQEVLIIRDAKRMSVNNPDVISSIAPWIMVVGAAYTKSTTAVGLIRCAKHFEGDLDAEKISTRGRRRSYDREKRTAINVCRMLDFLRERQWLSEEHMGRSVIANVLHDPALEWDDEVGTTKYRHMQITGYHAATLHLSTKLWPLFGDLSKMEMEYYFGFGVDGKRSRNRHPQSMRNHFTVSFRCKSMQAELNLGTPKSKRRNNKAEVERVMIKRIQEIANYVESISMVLQKCNDANDPRVLTSLYLMNQIREHRHILCAENFAYRADLNSDFPHREYQASNRRRLNFLSALQDEFFSAKVMVQAGSFVKDKSYEVVIGTKSLHIDITSHIYEVPMANMRSRDLSGCIVEKVRRKINDILGNDIGVFAGLVEFHIHLDVEDFMPPPTAASRMEEHQRKRSYQKRDLDGLVDEHQDGFREGSTIGARNLDSRPPSIYSTRVGASNEERRTEPPLGRNDLFDDGRSERDFVLDEGVQPLLRTGGSSAPVEMRTQPSDSGATERPELRNGRYKANSNRPGTKSRGLGKGQENIIDVHTVWRESWTMALRDWNDLLFIRNLHAVLMAKVLLERFDTMGEGENLQIYLHGCRLAFAADSIGMELSELALHRVGVSVGLTQKSKQGTEILGSGAIKDHFTPNCCWIVTKEGISRYASGDSTHGQSMTRFVHALAKITRTKFTMHEMSNPWKVLLLCNQQEGPLVTAASDCLVPFDIVQQVGEKVVLISTFKDAISRFGSSIAEISLLHSLSGCSECPSTKNVSQNTYIKAFVRCRRHYGRILSDVNDVRGLNLQGHSEIHKNLWLRMEVLTSIAYYLESARVNDLPAPLLQELQRDLEGFPHKLRVLICKEFLRRVSPTYLLPERSDLQLQFLRAFGTLKYWFCASEAVCDRSSLPCGLSTGFDEKGLPKHELEIDLKRRSLVMKKLFVTCGCKTGCIVRSNGSTKCACRKNTPPLVCLFCKCGPNCQNKGLPMESRITALEEANDPSSSTAPEVIPSVQVVHPVLEEDIPDNDVEDLEELPSHIVVEEEEVQIVEELEDDFDSEKEEE